MKKLLNFFGLYTKSQVDEVKNKCEKNYKDLIFDFDELLEHYSSQQLNALFFKMVNLTWGDKEKTYLLERWKNRICNAVETSKN